MGHIRSSEAHLFWPAGAAATASVRGVDWKKRRYIMTIPAIVFLILAGSWIQRASDGGSGWALWIGLIGSLVAGVAAVLAINQYANREVAEVRKGKAPTEAGKS